MVACKMLSRVPKPLFWLSGARRTLRRAGSFSLGLGAALLLSLPAAHAAPQGGKVVGGTGSISQPSGTKTVVNQKSSRLSIDWQSFDVGKGETVRFGELLLGEVPGVAYPRA